jgi:hypothetical protein
MLRGKVGYTHGVIVDGDALESFGYAYIEVVIDADASAFHAFNFLVDRLSLFGCIGLHESVKDFAEPED